MYQENKIQEQHIRPVEHHYSHNMNHNNGVSLPAPRPPIQTNVKPGPVSGTRYHSMVRIENC